MVRRLVIFAGALLVLSLTGLGLLLFRWSGERGAPTAGRLYVLGDFTRKDRLVSLERDPAGNACYAVTVAGNGRRAGRVCRGRPLRVWVEDALLDLTVGARGVPRLSIAGLRAREGDWLGSLADGKRPHPRFPLRGQGVPGLAGRVAACPPAPARGPHASICLEIDDRLGRVAIARAAGGTIDVPSHDEVVALTGGDVLWLGLVAFNLRLEPAGDRPPILALERIDRLRPGRGAGPALASDLGGDRRWLGRLWHAESPDPAAQVPNRFEIFAMHRRYTPRNLSRQRTNFEGEDVLQRLIDGGWLCLDDAAGDPEDSARRLAWRPLDHAGCGADHAGTLTRVRIDDYRRARFGDLAFLAGSLIDTANAALAAESYLDDASQLPFVFDWRLRAGDATGGDAGRRSAGRRVPQPFPARLWGVRFGITRQVRREANFRRGLPPDVLPRSSTARHLLQVLRGDELLASFYLPGVDAARTHRGGVCLGRHLRPEAAEPDAPAAVPLRPTSGGHHPLGSVAFTDDPRAGTWSADPDAACSGCRLALEVTGAGEALSVRPHPGEGPTAACDLASLPGAGTQDPWTLGHGEELAWDGLRLRHVARGERPWLAATDPGTGRRHFAEELYLQGRLRPLLGDAAALSGVEAALRELMADSGFAGVPPQLAAVELTIDGDLQLAAAGIVDALARPQIATGDPEPHRVSVTAAILDAEGGDLLAAVNWSSAGSEEGRRNAWSRPTSWELGSGQADVLENAALLRRGAIGSTMKITGSYALLNNDGLVPGPELDRRRRGRAFLEAPADRGRLYLHRGKGREPPSRRRCSTGPHYLPASDAGFTTGTFIRRFAASCNNFFVLTGLRHAGREPARLSEPSRWPAAGAGAGELLVDLRQRGLPRLVHPSPAVKSMAERIRDGLAGDFAGGHPRLPRSLYGILLRLGFQPRPALFTAQGVAAAELAFDHHGQPVAAALVNQWFSPTGEAATPALAPGRDFSYPGVPSPGRLDEATTGGRPTLERYDGTWRQVRRFAEGRADVQYAMLMIGQSSVEASALGLATLYAPAARADGRAVSPCLFRANCGPHRAGARVIDPAGSGAGILGQALRAVLRDGTARGGLWRAGRRHLPDHGWGGKTGTYQVERQHLAGLSPERWQRLRAWACGVEGVERPPIPPGSGRVADLAAVLARAPAGGALGARACEDPRFPLNPGGVHGYRGGELPARLDQLAAELTRSAETETEIYHSFVTLALPPRGEAVRGESDRGESDRGESDRGESDREPSPAQGTVIAVLVDRQTADKSLAIQIGAELAAAVERWAGSVR